MYDICSRFCEQKRQRLIKRDNERVLKRSTSYSINMRTRLIERVCLCQNQLVLKKCIVFVFVKLASLVSQKIYSNAELFQYISFSRSTSVIAFDFYTRTPIIICTHKALICSVFDSVAYMSGKRNSV